MPAYETAFEPPAPVAHVTLRNPANGMSWDSVPMLIDTGADVSLVPMEALQRLDLEPVPNKYYELLGFGGGVSVASVVRLEMSFLKRVFRGQFLLTEQGFGILGRNVLNAVVILLDGPNLRWAEGK